MSERLDYRASVVELPRPVTVAVVEQAV
jgi:hypothetical protein